MCTIRSERNFEFAFYFIVVLQHFIQSFNPSYDTVSVQQCQSSHKNVIFSKFGSPNKSRQDFFVLEVCKYVQYILVHKNVV